MLLTILTGQYGVIFDVTVISTREYEPTVHNNHN